MLLTSLLALTLFTANVDSTQQKFRWIFLYMSDDTVQPAKVWVGADRDSLDGHYMAWASFEYDSTKSTLREFTGLYEFDPVLHQVKQLQSTKVLAGGAEQSRSGDDKWRDIEKETIIEDVYQYACTGKLPE
jgi:hypothetical protein